MAPEPASRDADEETRAAISVAYVSNSARGEYTGRRRWIPALRRAGLQVTFVLPEGEEWYVERMREEGIEVLTYALDRSGLDPRRELASLRSLRQALNSRPFDLVHAFGHKANLYAAHLSPSLGRPRMCQHVTGMGSSFTASHPTPRDRLVRAVVRRAYLRYSPRIDRVFFQNPDDLRELPGLPADKTVLTAGTGVDVDEFDRDRISPTTRDALRAELELAPTDVVFTFVGRLLGDKGVRELLGAVDALHSDGPQLRVLLVGQLDPGNRSGLGAEEAEHYRSHPALRVLGRREDVRDLLAITDVFVNPSYREGLPRTQIEAMAMQLPVVACDVPGSRETVLDGETGILVPPREPAALAEAMRSFLEDPSLRRRMGVRGAALARRRYSVERVTAELVATYSEFLPALRASAENS